MQLIFCQLYHNKAVFMHVSIAHRHRQQGGEGWDEDEGWVVEEKGKKEGTSVIVSTIP